MSTPDPSTEAKFAWPGRAFQVWVAILSVSLVSAAALTATSVYPYEQLRDVLWPIADSSLTTQLPLSVLGVALWFALRTGLRGFGRAASWIALLAFAPVLYPLLKKVNKDYLPEMRSTESIIGNAVLLLLFAAAGAALAFLLQRWQSGEAWRKGRFPLLGVIVLGGAAAWPMAQARKMNSDEPNVVIIMLDVLRADHLGCYGYERDTSPNIDEFTKDAVLFEQAISSSSFTKSSVASLFTGLNMHNHGVYLGDLEDTHDQITSDVLEGQLDTIAELMFRQGLHTEAWVQNGQLRNYMGFSQGFSRYHDQVGPGHRIVDQHNSWLRSGAATARFFTYLHFLDIHAPYTPASIFWGKFAPKDRGIEQMGYADWRDFKRSVRRGEIELTSVELDTLRDRYDECILTVDHYVGRVLNDLKASGKYDNSLIVITGDHGEAFGEHGKISHSTTPYDELVHVPLIIKLPNSQHGGRRFAPMVRLIDVAPTLLDFVEAAPPEGMDGESFLDILETPDAEFEQREVFVEIQKIMGLRTERWKYIERVDEPAQLYDLSADPGELHNVIDQHPDIAKEFARKVARAREIRDSKGPVERVVVDEETVQELEAIGYM